MESLVIASEAAAFYQPEQLYDRENLYFTEADESDFRRDYFSPSLWKKLPVRADQRAPRLSLR
jgi:hypothetical protein